MKTETNSSGFNYAEFTDEAKSKCSIREVNILDEENKGCLMLGVDNPKIVIYDKEMKNYVVMEKVPHEWLIGSQLLLNRKQIEQLIPMLQNFLETGKLQ